MSILCFLTRLLLMLGFGVCCGALNPEFRVEESVIKDENICRDIEVWSAQDAAVFANCSVIEGHVRIMQVKNDLQPLVFPLLREIVGYLMVFRITGYETLADIFPNLSVIRGNILFEGYSLIIFESFDLKSLGLISLKTVIKGNLFIASNVNLCFVDTVNWSEILSGNRDSYIAGNKNPNECEVCNCKGSGCWNRMVCQTECPSSCSQNCVDGEECCHPTCLGGCLAFGSDQCFACRNYYYNGVCVDKCPVDTYVYLGWRCIHEEECSALPTNHPSKRWKIHEGSCVLDCPTGYHEKEINSGGNKSLRCLACEGGLCRKECTGELISSVEDSRKMLGCTTVRGGLMISFSETAKNLVAELEKNLNSIEEITGYLKISDSYQLTSLNFLRNLRHIKGHERYKSKYSLTVVGNKNLELLWDFDNKGSELTINGSVYFRSNPKLCVSKIQELLDRTNVPTSEAFYPNLTNGVKSVCNLRQLTAGITNITAYTVSIFWVPIEFHDMRKLMGYIIYIKRAPFRNITVYDGRDECGGGDWQVHEVSFLDGYAYNYTIRGLDPFNTYAYYVKSVTINADFGAQSTISYFDTLPSIPSSPYIHPIKVISDSEIQIKWVPPKNPNGEISYYLVSIRKEEETPLAQEVCKERKKNIFERVTDYLEDELSHDDYYNKSSFVSNESGETSPDKKRSKSVAELRREKEIYLENLLQNYIYVPRPSRRKRHFIISNETESENWTYNLTESNSGNTTITSGNIHYDVNCQLDSQDKSLNVGRCLNIGNLYHFSTYYIRIQACRKLIAGERSTSRDFCSRTLQRKIKTEASRTADVIPNEYPLLEVSNKDHGNVILKWEGPQNPNGHILYYSVEYKRKGYSPITECVEPKNSYILKKLRPGNYSVRIRATSSSGTGPFTSPKYFFIEDSASIQTYIYLILGTLLFILPPAIAYCIYYLKKTEKNKLFISVNPEYTHKTYVADAWEIPRNQIDLIKEIGQGSFGMVYEGLLNSKPCAVKTVNTQASENEKKEFLNEACVMKAFDTFHVVKLLGVVSSGEPVYVVMELMPNGDLKSFLRSHRPDVCDPHVAPPSIRRLLQMSAEIADGMAYLSAKKFVHRDLAARNCMVAENLTVKIGDFGMARDIYVGDYYRKGTRGLMPVRWMAPESLRDGIFLSASDVWSYGVVLYEMVTLAAQPYQGLTNEQVLRYITDGGVMERPENCCDKMFNLMRLCWRQDPVERPTFLNIVETLHEDASLNFHAVSFYDSNEGREHRNNTSPNSYPLLNNYVNVR